MRYILHTLKFGKPHTTLIHDPRQAKTALDIQCIEDQFVDGSKFVRLEAITEFEYVVLSAYFKYKWDEYMVGVGTNPSRALKVRERWSHIFEKHGM